LSGARDDTAFRAFAAAESPQKADTARDVRE
jgi:hypothetical protein